MAVTKPNITSTKITITLSGRDAVLFNQALLVFYCCKDHGVLRRKDSSEFAKQAVSAVALELLTCRSVTRPMAVSLRRETEGETAARLDYINQVELFNVED